MCFVQYCIFAGLSMTWQADLDRTSTSLCITNHIIRCYGNLENIIGRAIQFLLRAYLLVLKPTNGSLLLRSKLLDTTLTLLIAIARLAHTGSSLTCPPLLVRTG